MSLANGPPERRAVFITPVLPMHTGMGLAMRAAIQLEALTRTFDVTVLFVPLVDTGHGLPRFRAAFPNTPIEVIGDAAETDAYFGLISRMRDPAEQLLHFARYGRPSLAARVSDTVIRRIAEHISRNGIGFAHVFRSYLAGTLRDTPGHVIRSIDLDEDDEASFLSSAKVLAAGGQDLAARWASLEAASYGRILGRELASFRAVTLANPDDLACLAQRHPALPASAVPNSVSLPRLGLIGRRKRSGNPNMLFVGSLRYLPNVDGLLWFIRSVLPRLPGARLRIVGRAPPESLRVHARAGRVEFMGYVEDLATAYREAALAIAPMRSGGGTRLKILEAAAHGVPVVATRVAAAGLWTSQPPWGIAADSAIGFSVACKRLLTNPQDAVRLGRRGRHAVSRRYAHERIRNDWMRLFHDLQKR